MAPEYIHFPDGGCARIVETPPRAPAGPALDVLQLTEPRPVIAVAGAAAQLDKNLEPRLGQLFARGVVRVAVRHGAAIVDGGTQSGVMELVGQAVADRGQGIVLIGVAPAGKVILPTTARASDSADTIALEPHHTHFVLVQANMWGVEVDTMDSVCRILAGSCPGVTVLANGGSIALDEVLRSVRRGWPVVVLAGTGRLADQIAQLATQRRRSFVVDPRLAEVLEDGKLEIFPANGSAQDLVRVLDQHLRAPEAEPALEAAWRQFAFLDANATGERASFSRLQAGLLILGVLATFLALVQTQFGSTPVGEFLRIVLLLTTLGATVLAGASIRFKAGSRWVLLRGAAETIKQEVFRYRARVSPYATDARGAELAVRVGRITTQLFAGDVSELALRPYRGRIPPQTVGHVADDSGFGVLSGSEYAAVRLADQMTFYQARALRLDRRLRVALWLTLLLGGTATLLTALGGELWVPLATALASAIAAYLEYQQVGPTLAKFNQAAASLNSIQEWWLALSAIEQGTAANVEKLVDSTEQILEAELTGWVRQMRDALEKLYSEERQRQASDG